MEITLSNRKRGSAWRRRSPDSELPYLPNIDLEQSVGMVVTPSPIGLLIVVVQRGEGVILAMILFRIHAIRLILMIVPLMIVVVLFVMVAAGAFILGS